MRHRKGEERDLGRLPVGGLLEADEHPAARWTLNWELKVALVKFPEALCAGAACAGPAPRAAAATAHSTASRRVEVRVLVASIRLSALIADTLPRYPAPGVTR